MIAINDKEIHVLHRVFHGGEPILESEMHTLRALHFKIHDYVMTRSAMQEMAERTTMKGKTR
ncbi:MAG: hypothetical protein KGL39_56145 [Patescibacteria group bacterium]|nr:hypothetical protein [Patescibacteria group bacterium]